VIRHLNADLSFCELDGRLFFLDIENDRYFQLSGALERSFLRHLEAPDDTSIDVSELARHQLLLQPTTIPCDASAAAITPPDQSAVETPCTGRRVTLDVVQDVFLAVAITYWQLKTRPLKSILQGLYDYRQARTSPPAADQAACRQRISEAATAFNRARPYVPIGTCCLIDSLSMVRFLARRGLGAQLVMGVACDPFSAHAWVQHGSLVLNETVGTAQAHVPIRVI